MSSKPRDASDPSQSSPPDEAWARLDLLTAESEAQLDRWSYKEKQLFAELIEDAGTELQQELLFRAVASGHRPAEVHAFADVIRGLTDAEIFAACTLDPVRAARESVEDRLWAEADPIYGYLLNGYRLSPKDENPPPRAGASKAEQLLELPQPTFMSLKPRAPDFNSEDSDIARRRSKSQPDLISPAKATPAKSGAFSEDLFNEALRPMGISLAEHVVDGSGGMPLETALVEAAAALSRSIPLPIVLGSAVGEFRRYALILQTQGAGRSRAFQIHDPFAEETIWANEADLLSRTELRFSDKANRRITAIALPRASFSLAASSWKG